MEEIIKAIAQWLAPIVGTAITAYIAVVQRNGEQKRDSAVVAADEQRRIEQEWREDMERRMADFEKVLESMNKKMDATLKGQLTDMRTDIVHKAHRYLDDLGCASTDEKNAFDAQYKTYAQLCDENDIKNDFINTLHDQVMALPGRTVREG